MPVIKVECSIDIEKEEQLIKFPYRQPASIMGIPEAAHVVLLNEMSKDNIGVGGEMPSKKLARSHSFKICPSVMIDIPDILIRLRKGPQLITLKK